MSPTTQTCAAGDSKHFQHAFRNMLVYASRHLERMREGSEAFDRNILSLHLLRHSIRHFAFMTQRRPSSSARQLSDLFDAYAQDIAAGDWIFSSSLAAPMAGHNDRSNAHVCVANVAMRLQETAIHESEVFTIARMCARIGGGIRRATFAIGARRASTRPSANEC
jgi:hypothetical protein